MRARLYLSPMFTLSIWTLLNATAASSFKTDTEFHISITCHVQSSVLFDSIVRVRRVESDITPSCTTGAEWAVICEIMKPFTHGASKNKSKGHEGRTRRPCARSRAYIPFLRISSLCRYGKVRRPKLSTISCPWRYRSMCLLHLRAYAQICI